ncbi:fibronectin type III domain-containing protein, partial [Candidatus Parcubacteria bacterium]|nr:fibronectin type III domain-containing protein [Candidatus Parcubacteria bacterium]
FFAFSLVFTTVGVANTSSKTDLSAGMLIKGKNSQTVYYYAENNKRYVFPNSSTFYSWFDDFSNVVEIDDDELALYHLGGNVRYKPGVLMVKIQTDPKVYAVSNNGSLRWIKTEALAQFLYGKNWSLLVDDVDNSLFTNYNIGDPIESESEYEIENEEWETDSISCNLGLKAKKQIRSEIQTANQKLCGNLKGTINKIQKRLQRRNMVKDNIGDDYIDQCLDTANNNLSKKVTICHIPKGNPANAHTITISVSALRAHIKNGDYIGSCEGDNGETPDTIAPNISGISADTSTSTATISWTTDEASNSEMVYALESISTTTATTTEINNTMATSHAIVLEGLTPETTYHYIVKSTDDSYNQAVSGEETFTTLELPDITAPVISEISTSTSSSTATISWETDEDAIGRVGYATGSIDTILDPGIIEVIPADSFLPSQSVELTGMATSTRYFFIIEAEDKSNNIAISTSTEQYFDTSSL